MHRGALRKLRVRAVVLDQRLKQLARREPEHNLRGRAHVDQPLHHRGHAVGPRRAERLDPYPFRPDHAKCLAQPLGHSMLDAERRFPEPHLALRGRQALDHLDRHEIRDAQEVRHVRVDGLLVDLVRVADLDDLAVAHDRHPVGHGQRLFLVVRDVQERDADPLLQRLELDLQRPAELGVQRAERLVEQQHGRVEHQRPGQGHPLLLPAGQLAGPALGERAEMDQVDGLPHPGLQLLLGQLPVTQAEGHIVEHGEKREQRVALEHRVDVPLVGRNHRHVDVVEQYPAGRRLLEPGDQPQRGRLAAARGTEQREELPAGHGQVDLVDGELNEALGQRHQLDLSSGHCSLPS